jgi:hypothetical protein
MSQMRLVEQIFFEEHRDDFRTRYIKYRAGRLKHQYWLWNRKNSHKVVDAYDRAILDNCQPGRTAFFSSAGYYLRDIWPEIDSIEMHSVVKEFYPEVKLISNRDNMHKELTELYDNFAVVNNRGDHWVDTRGLTRHLACYSRCLRPGARLFYSFRDTQIIYHRLRDHGPTLFLEWARSLSLIDLDLVWHDIQFPRKVPNGAGEYDLHENPDTVNGNLKFWFVYKGRPWR